MRALLFALLLAGCASASGPASDPLAGTAATHTGNGVWSITCTGHPSSCGRRADAVCEGGFQVIETGPTENAARVRDGHGMIVRCN
jgi:hypothetical protein